MSYRRARQPGEPPSIDPLATAAGDPYLQALALACAGLATVEHGHPDDGLKMLQFAHVRAGESDGLGLAHGAISSVKQLSSVRARKRLLPLAEALDARPGSDTRDLARMARQVATTRA